MITTNENSHKTCVVKYNRSGRRSAIGHLCLEEGAVVSFPKQAFRYYNGSHTQALDQLSEHQTMTKDEDVLTHREPSLSRDHLPRDSSDSPSLGGEEGLQCYLNILQHGGRLARWRAANAIRRVGEAATPDLIRILYEGDRQARALAAWVFQKTGDPRATDALITALDDPYQSVRTVASHALDTVGTPEALAAVKAWRSGR
jgi:hypothetical protein